MERTKLYLEAYTLSLLLIERLDELGDTSQRGVKHHSKELIKAIENEEKGVGETSAAVASILSKGVDEIMTQLMKEVLKTK